MSVIVNGRNEHFLLTSAMQRFSHFIIIFFLLMMRFIAIGHRFAPLPRPDHAIKSYVLSHYKNHFISLEFISKLITRNEGNMNSQAASTR